MKKAIAFLITFNVLWLFFIKKILTLTNNIEETDFTISISGALSALTTFAIFSSFNKQKALELISLENTKTSFSHILISALYIAFIFFLLPTQPSENLTILIEKIKPSNFIAIILLAPVVEELVFRGAVFKSLERSRYSPSLIIIMTSISFSVIHVHHETIFQLFMFPVVLIIGHARYITGNVITPCIIHILLNLTVFVLSMETAI